MLYESVHFPIVHLHLCLQLQNEMLHGLSRDRDLICLSQTTNCAILHMDREGTHSKVAGFVLVSYTADLADRRASSSKLRQREAELSEAGDSVGEGNMDGRKGRDIRFELKSISYV